MYLISFIPVSYLKLIGGDVTLSPPLFLIFIVFWFLFSLSRYLSIATNGRCEVIVFECLLHVKQQVSDFLVVLCMFMLREASGYFSFIKILTIRFHSSPDKLELDGLNASQSRSDKSFMVCRNLL